MYRTLTLKDIGFSYNNNIDYEDNIWIFTDLMPSVSRILISNITDTPDRLITCIKKLIDVWGLENVIFSNDYQYLIKSQSYE